MSEDRFALPEELEEFRSLVREIVEERIGLARAAEIDETDEFPWDVHKLFVENELMAVGYPEEFGGSGGGSLTFAVGLGWAFLQPYRVTLLHPHGQGFWWLFVEPPLLVMLVGVVFQLLVAPGLVADLEEADATSL